MSFNFGGQNYPIHPLDLVDDNLGLTDSTGQRVCLGAVCFPIPHISVILTSFPLPQYQPITSAFNIFGTFDMILGMSFCESSIALLISMLRAHRFDSIIVRNTYTLLNGGNSIGDSVDQVDPYVQLASIIDPIAAKQDFINIRLGGNTSALSDPIYALLPANESQHSPIPPGEKTKELEEKVLSRLPYILLGAVILLALITGCCIWQCCCRGKNRRCCRRKAKNLPSNDPRVFVPGTGNISYVPLENRSMKDDSSAYSVPAYQGEYGKGGKGFTEHY